MYSCTWYSRKTPLSQSLLMVLESAAIQAQNVSTVGFVLPSVQDVVPQAGVFFASFPPSGAKILLDCSEPLAFL
ncbi:hypothetical protein DFS33DRAFT_1361671 [Desarmillaria ectypa]|nr:hypothetical protein DFS33DRAFT_1361671 [Desarmillaria ectypa]